MVCPGGQARAGHRHGRCPSPPPRAVLQEPWPVAGEAASGEVSAVGCLFTTGKAWGAHQALEYFFLNLFNVYLFLKEKETEHERGRGRERGRLRIQSRLQAPSCQHRARSGARTHEPNRENHDLSRNHMLNRLSRPGVPEADLVE